MASGRGRPWRARRGRGRAPIAVTSLALLAVLLAACGEADAVSLPPQQSFPPAPTPISNPTNGGAPPARMGAAVGFDVITRTLLMFGGAPATGTNLSTGHPAQRLDETWSWDGLQWKQLHPKTSPPALYGARMVIDPNTKQLLLVSGAGDSSGNALAQEGMWAWDGDTWKRVADNPVQVPFPAAGYDPVRSQLVLSGFDPAYPSACLGCIPPPDFDRGGDFVLKEGGGGWTNASGDAPGWARAGTAYDPISQRIISAAGAKQNGVQSSYAWDGRQWTQTITPNASTGHPDPGQPLGPCDAATDQKAMRIVMVCASASGPSGGTTWTFDGKAWQNVPGANMPAIPADPSLGGAAGLLSLAYDPDLPALVMLVGGASGTETIAEWNGNSWSAVAST